MKSNHSFLDAPNLSIKEMSMLLGLSIGSPKTLAQIPFDKHPKALETPNTTV